MSNAQKRGKRDSSAKYATRERKAANKRRRIERDARRANPQECGHGSRHKSNIDGTCKRCYGRLVI